MDQASYENEYYMQFLDKRASIAARGVGHSFKRFTEYLKGIVRPGWRVLDYGCGHGSLGYLGRDENTGVMVEGFDKAINNKDAMYHRLDEITEHYDAIILCHILEHVSFNDCCSIIEWCRGRADHLIIVLPCTTNVVMNAIFDSDLEHKDKYDNDDFIQILEECGYTVKVSRCDIIGYDKQNIIKVLFRFGLNFALGLSPFFCYVMECETNHAR